MNFWTSVRLELPLEIILTCFFFLSCQENLKISLKAHTQEERLRPRVKRFPFKFVTHKMVFKVFIRQEFLQKLWTKQNQDTPPSPFTTLKMVSASFRTKSECITYYERYFYWWYACYWVKLNPYYFQNCALSLKPGNVVLLLPSFPGLRSS